MKSVTLLLNLSLSLSFSIRLSAEETLPPKGHTRLLLHASHPEVSEISPYSMRQTEDVLRKRLAVGPLPGVLTPRPAIRIVNGDQFEILLPTTDETEIDRIVRRLQRPGGLEFAILADRHRHQNLITQARRLPEKQTRLMSDQTLLAQWVDSMNDVHGKPIEIGDANEVITRTVSKTQGAKSTQRTQYLVVYEDSEDHVVAEYLWKAKAVPLPDDGGYAIGYDWGSSGGSLIEALTRKYQQDEDGTTYRLGVLLDGKLHSAPVLHGVIDGPGQIEVDLTTEEVFETVKVLNSGTHWLHLQVLSTISNE